MSGIEVAGIALALFPIVVDGISHFAAGAQTISNMRRCRARLEDYSDIIDSQRAAYLDALEELLEDIVHSDEEMRLLLVDPTGVAWRNPAYDVQLRQRLDRSYGVYLLTVGNIRDSLEKLRKRLGIDISGEVQWEEYSLLERQMKRLKVGLLKDVNKELINDIDKAIEKISQLIRRNVVLEPKRKKRKSKRPTEDLKLVKKHAASLHHVFITGESWKCPCRTLHVASLRLEPRPDANLENTTSQYRFRILVSISRGSRKPPGLQRWQEIEVRSSLTTVTEQSQLAVTGPGKGVRFASNTVVEASNITATLEKGKLIADICTVLSQNSAMHECLGFLVDERDQYYKHHIYLTEKTTLKEPRSKSLGDLLATPGSESGSNMLYRKERLEIAITLASSVLQLDGTDWLKSQWTSNDIFFHEGINEELTDPYKYPYLPWKQCTLESELSASMKSLMPRSPFIRNKVLFALGLTLVELCFGKTLHNMRESEDDDFDEATTIMNCAFRMLDSRAIWRNMGEQYEAVVRRCLRQTFDVSDMSLDNEDLQQQVYENVVIPLTDELNDFLGKSRIR